MPFDSSFFRFSPALCVSTPFIYNFYFFLVPSLVVHQSLSVPLSSPHPPPPPPQVSVSISHFLQFPKFLALGLEEFVGDLYTLEEFAFKLLPPPPSPPPIPAGLCMWWVIGMSQHKLCKPAAMVPLDPPGVCAQEWWVGG